MAGLDAAQARRNLLERFGAKIPLLAGYLERDLLREVDKLEREYLADVVDRTRGSLQRKIHDWSRQGALTGIDLASSLDKLLDRFGNRIRHADYGASGVFDAVKIGEPELAKLYHFDVALLDTVEALSKSVANLGDKPDPEALRLALGQAEQADRSFDHRATIYHDVVPGGR